MSGVWRFCTLVCHLTWLMNCDFAKANWPSELDNRPHLNPDWCAYTKYKQNYPDQEYYDHSDSTNPGILGLPKLIINKRHAKVYLAAIWMVSVHKTWYLVYLKTFMAFDRILAKKHEKGKYYTKALVISDHFYITRCPTLERKQEHIIVVCLECLVFLFISDGNLAADRQALAGTWRNAQTRNCDRHCLLLKWCWYYQGKRSSKDNQTHTYLSRSSHLSFIIDHVQLLQLIFNRSMRNKTTFELKTISSKEKTRNPRVICNTETQAVGQLGVVLTEAII
ncbi:unnamed protein product [Absidia cylindrospora]